MSPDPPGAARKAVGEAGLCCDGHGSDRPSARHRCTTKEIHWGGLGMGGVQDGPKKQQKAADPSSMDGIQFFF